MIDIHPNYVAKTLTGFCVVYFKNRRHAPDVPPHYHITIPVNDDSSLLLGYITDEIENRLWYYRKANKEDAITSLVRVDKNILPFLKHESIIECNQALLVSKQEFDKIVDPKVKLDIKMRDIPKELKEKIIEAIKKSPVVKPFIKKLIKDL
ncbi:MAG: hypothetical protein FD156_1405 [Nitrospirae bacterium]|nr:MAG: hypothetical protein FD156_1405 [Nitrospirota bacterium]